MFINHTYQIMSNRKKELTKSTELIREDHIILFKIILNV